MYLKFMYNLSFVIPHYMVYHFFFILYLCDLFFICKWFFITKLCIVNIDIMLEVFMDKLELYVHVHVHAI